MEQPTELEALAWLDIVGALIRRQMAEIERLRADNERLPADIREALDLRLNNYLCDMKPDYDDSITGFNEAWDIMRKYLAGKP